MRAKQLWIACALVLGAAAAGALFALRHRAPSAAATPEVREQPAQPPSEILVPAKIRAQNVVPVSVPVQGAVESLAVEVGQEVYEGQVLARIRNTALDTDQQSASAEFERAQARFNELESQWLAARTEASRARSEAARVQAEFDRIERAYLRQQMLYKEGATPRLVFEKAAREWEAAKGERETADGLARGAEDRLAVLARNMDAARHAMEADTQTLDRARQAAAAAEIRSPATGLVVARTKQVGEEVAPGVQDLFQIAVDVSALEAIAEPEAAALPRMRAGQEVLLAIAEAPNPIPARITEIRGSEVVIRFTSPTPAVRPGLTAQARVRLD